MVFTVLVLNGLVSVQVKWWISHYIDITLLSPVSPIHIYTYPISFSISIMDFTLFKLHSLSIKMTHSSSTRFFTSISLTFTIGVSSYKISTLTYLVSMTEKQYSEHHKPCRPSGVSVEVKTVVDFQTLVGVQVIKWSSWVSWFFLVIWVLIPNNVVFLCLILVVSFLQVSRPESSWGTNLEGQ